MRLISMMPCKNEGWVAGLSLRAALLWTDAIVVLLHDCTDESVDIVNQVQRESGADRVIVISETSPVWEEMRHRQRMLDTARKHGATHLGIIDFDEILSGDLLPTIRDMVLACPANATMQLPWLCLRDSHLQVHRSGVWGEQSASMAFVDNPELHWSSAGRANYDFHHRPPMGRPYSAHNPVAGRASGLMHLQFVNARRLRAKQALYQATEVLRWPGRETPDQIRRKYSLSVYGQNEPNATGFDLVPCPPLWWEPYQYLMNHYNPDAEPWQERELKRLVAEHGAAKFEGLDFFGVV